MTFLRFHFDKAVTTRGSVMLLPALILLFAGAAQAQFTVLWDKSGAYDSSRYGQVVISLGDQNQDGYADWAVYSAGNTAPGTPEQSRLEFFHGGNPPDTIPYMTRLADGISELGLGYAQAFGDLNVMELLNGEFGLQSMKAKSVAMKRSTGVVQIQ
jgi:hypothetical protein